MKKRFFRTIIIGMSLVIYVSLNQNTNAQVYTSLNYSISFPSDFQGDFLGTTSFQGLNLELGYMVTPKIMAGLRGGWHSFYEERSAREYVVENVTFYGKQYRYVDSYPLLLSARYAWRNPEQPSILNPYVGLGLGGYIFKRRMNIGIYNFSDNKTWHWGLQPEAGVLIKTKSKLEINAGVRYNQLFGNGDTGSNGYVGVFAGLLFFPKK